MNKQQVILRSGRVFKLSITLVNAENSLGITTATLQEYVIYGALLETETLI